LYYSHPAKQRKSFRTFKVNARTTVARKSSIGGLNICVGGLTFQNLAKTPLSYSVSHFNLGGLGVLFGTGTEHTSRLARSSPGFRDRKPEGRSFTCSSGLQTA